jgi:hypothetical protein
MTKFLTAVSTLAFFALLCVGSSHAQQAAQGGQQLTIVVGGSCSAKNQEDSVTCSITCPVGKQAVCYNVNGGNTPACECK